MCTTLCIDRSAARLADDGDGACPEGAAEALPECETAAVSSGGRRTWRRRLQRRRELLCLKQRLGAAMSPPPGLERAAGGHEGEGGDEEQLCLFVLSGVASAFTEYRMSDVLSPVIALVKRPTDWTEPAVLMLKDHPEWSRPLLLVPDPEVTRLAVVPSAMRTMLDDVVDVLARAETEKWVEMGGFFAKVARFMDVLVFDEVLAEWERLGVVMVAECTRLAEEDARGDWVVPMATGNDMDMFFDALRDASVPAALWVETDDLFGMLQGEDLAFEKALRDGEDQGLVETAECLRFTFGILDGSAPP